MPKSGGSGGGGGSALFGGGPTALNGSSSPRHASCGRAGLAGGTAPRIGGELAAPLSARWTLVVGDAGRLLSELTLLLPTTPG
jgi:hypothetical protein